MNKNMLNAVKLAAVTGCWQAADLAGIELTDEQQEYLENLINATPVQGNKIPDGVSANTFVVSKIEEVIAFLDDLWERHERLTSLED